MEFAVNYSPALAGLVHEGAVAVDRFKCPAWPQLFGAASQERPIYVHFPLRIGSGQGCAINDETGQPADLEWVADMLAQTGTPLVNTHMMPTAKDHPDIPIDSREPRHIQRVIDAVMRDLEPLILRFGAERVTVENIINEYGWLTLAVLPEVITRVLEQTGCGFLFDLSHARLAARSLGVDERIYCQALPVERIREIHFTGLRMISGDLLARIQAAGDPGGFAERYAGKWIDHLPMDEPDWPEVAWAMQQVHTRKWAAPWVVAYEFGGVGGFWELFSRRETYLAELPRLQALVKPA